MVYGILCGLVPALLWGVNPTFVGKLKTNPLQQQIGTTAGAFLLSLLIFFITFSRTISDLSQNYLYILIPFISGFLWSFGQFFQYKSFIALSTGEGYSISTGIMLVFNSLFSCIVLHEWQDGYQYALGFSSIAVIILGCVLSTERTKKDEKRPVSKLLLGLLFVTISAICLALFASLPKLVTTENVEGLSTLLPQSCGTVLGTVIIVLAVRIYELSRRKKDENYPLTVLFEKKTLLSTTIGVSHGLANIGLIYANQLAGLAIGFTMSQTGVVFNTIFSYVFLKEYKGKSRTTIILSIIGVLLIISGCVMISFTML